jgi:large subunit ribosomal protein L13
MKRQDTYYAKPDKIENKWWIIDAKGQILGRIASQVASIVRGKNKVDFTPSMDVGDFVVIINAEQIKVTGNKEEDKIYYRHSGYPGGLKAIAYKDLMKKDPTEVLFKAIKGMLPKNKLGRKLHSKVKIYCGEKHPHEAQLPEKLELN